MGTPRICLVFSAVVIAETVACGTILGDFPDGQLNADASFDGGDLDAPPNAKDALVNGPPSAICIAPHADIIDFAVDGAWIYWLQATSDDQSVFSLARCEIATAIVSTMGPPLPARPEAIALSDQFVFWTINQKTDGGAPGGVWRFAKAGQDQADHWRLFDQAGPIAFADDHLFVATHDGNIYRTSPTAATDAQAIATGQSNPTAIAASATDVYWSATNASLIFIAPFIDSGVGAAATFWGNAYTTPSLVAAGTRGAFWNNSVRALGYGIFYQACPQSGGCQPKTMSAAPMDPGGITAINGDFYWTTNEGRNGIVHKCPNAEAPETTSCPADGSIYKQLDAELSHIAADANYVYFAAKYSGDAYIVRISR